MKDVGSNEKFVEVRSLFKGIHAVKYESGLWGFIDASHISICKRHFNRVGYSGYDLAVQREDGLWNFLDMNGKVLYKKWRKGLSIEAGEIERVRAERGWNIATPDGTILFPGNRFWAEQIVAVDVVVPLKSTKRIITLVE